MTDWRVGVSLVAHKRSLFFLALLVEVRQVEQRSPPIYIPHRTFVGSALIDLFLSMIQ